MFIRPPHPVSPHQRIGLFGGSFDPPHNGHRLAACRALQLLALDHIWWLPTPQNPLKPEMPAPVTQRQKAVLATLCHPRMHVVSDTQRFTLQTVQTLQARFPQVRFVLIIGLDSARTFHAWHHWQEILALIPLLVINRAPNRLGSHPSVLRQLHTVRHIALNRAGHGLDLTPRTVYWDGAGPTSTAASTYLRQRSRT